MEVSNADRIVFPGEGITKGEVVSYYEAVAERMLPFVANRALTVERYPRGIESEGFMQKNAPEHFDEEVIGRHEVPKADGGSTVYPVVEEADAIVAFANLGVITFHVPPSTVDQEEACDWMIWDLDPPSGDFELVRRAAGQLREVLEGFQIETVVLASGSNGYHLRTRLEPRIECGVASGIVRGTAALAAAANPDSMTLAFRKSERKGRVFVDWLRNAPYSTSVAPWSLRALPHAPVATPISWQEVVSIDPDGVLFRSVRDRFRVDPWKGPPASDLRGVAESVQEALIRADIEMGQFDRFRS